MDNIHPLRKEEILNAAKNYASHFPPEYIDERTYIEGAEWADRSIIEKAQNFFRTTHHLHKLDGMELKNFIEDFRKIMKE